MYIHVKEETFSMNKRRFHSESLAEIPAFPGEVQESSGLLLGSGLKEQKSGTSSRLAVVRGSSVPGQRSEDADTARRLGEAVDSPVMAAQGLAGRWYLVHRDKRGPCIQPTHLLSSQQG